MVHRVLALRSLSCCFSKAWEAQGKPVCHALQPKLWGLHVWYFIEVMLSFRATMLTGTRLSQRLRGVEQDAGLRNAPEGCSGSAGDGAHARHHLMHKHSKAGRRHRTVSASMPLRALPIRCHCLIA